MNTNAHLIFAGTEPPRTIDNVSCRLGDDIAGILGADSTVYVASGGFSLSAFEHLADELEKVKAVRFIFTAPNSPPREVQLDRKYALSRERQRIGRELGRVVP